MPRKSRQEVTWEKCLHAQSENCQQCIHLNPYIADLCAFVLLRVLVPVVAHRLENQGHCPLQLCAANSVKSHDVLRPHCMEVELRLRSQASMCGTTCPAPLMSRETGRGEATPAPCTGCSQVDSCMWAVSVPAVASHALPDLVAMMSPLHD